MSSAPCGRRGGWGGQKHTTLRPLKPVQPLRRDKGMRHMVGPDWRQLFDVVIVQADKPSFFTDRRKYGPRRGCGLGRGWRPYLSKGNRAQGQIGLCSPLLLRMRTPSYWCALEWLGLFRGEEGGTQPMALSQTGIYPHPGLSENWMRRAHSTGTGSPVWKRARSIVR